MKKGSMPSIRAGRHRARPTALAVAPESARAALLGLNPISAAIARIRCRVASDTPGWPFSAYDTAPLETPARRATSAMVGRFTGALLHWSGPRGPVSAAGVTGGCHATAPRRGGVG